MTDPARGDSRGGLIPRGGSGEKEEPGSEDKDLRAEYDGDRGDGTQPLARVDRRGDEPPEEESAREAAEVRGVAYIRDREPQVEVQGKQDEELPDQGILPG